METADRDTPLMRLEELERLAYISGDTEKAALLAALIDELVGEQDAVQEPGR